MIYTVLLAADGMIGIEHNRQSELADLNRFFAGIRKCDGPLN